MAITRHGINRQEVGCLMRCSFEDTVDVLLEAACFSEVDPLKGVSKKIMLGQLPMVGAGCYDLHVDIEGCKKAVDNNWVFSVATPSAEAIEPAILPMSQGATPAYGMGEEMSSPRSPYSGAMATSLRHLNQRP